MSPSPSLPRIDVTDDHRLLLRAALLDGNAAADAWREWRARVPFDDIDGASHRLVPLLARRIGDLAPDDPLRQLILGIYRHAWGRNQLLIRDAASIVAALGERSVPVIVLKGAALFAYFDNDWGARPMYDVDFLVRTESVSDAVDVLAERGWTGQLGVTGAWLRWRALPRRNGWGFEHGTDGRLDLHWHVLGGSVGARADEAFWEASEPFTVGSLRARALHPADLLLHLIAHGATTEPSENMQWIADATMVMRTIGVDGLHARLGEQARAHALVEKVQSCLDTVVRCIDEPVAAALRDGLGDVRRRPMERAARSPRSPGLVRSAARELVHFGGGHTSALSSVRAATSVRFDLGLVRHPAFAIAYAASGRSSTVAALGRRAFGSFARTPVSPSAVEAGAELDFTDIEVADRHAGPGWFRPTEQGLRAVGREMRVVLPLASTAERALRLTVETIAPAGRPSIVEVSVNERPVGRMTVADDAIGRASFVVPASLANRFDPLEIAFRGPRGTGTRAMRRESIALCLRRIEVD